MERVSVIIPTHNRKTYIPEAIGSVYKQTFIPEEIIVVDDGSTDGTRVEIERRYGHTIRYIAQPNRGVAAARNKGIALAQGDYIAFLDSDDYWKPRKLEKQIQFFRSNPNYLICYTDETWLRNEQQVSKKSKHKKYAGWIVSQCLQQCFIGTSTVMINRKIFDQVGTYDEQLTVCEDYDLWLRISSRYPIGYIDEQLAVKRAGHGDQLSFRFWGMDRFRITAIEKLLKQQCLSNEQQSVACKTLKKKCQILVNGYKKRGKIDESEYYHSLAQQLCGESHHVSID